jgi:hypothetical protein
MLWVKTGNAKRKWHIVTCKRVVLLELLSDGKGDGCCYVLCGTGDFNTRKGMLTQGIVRIRTLAHISSCLQCSLNVTVNVRGMRMFTLQAISEIC